MAIPDLSEHNETPDFDAMARSVPRPELVIIRAGFGTVREDHQFRRNWSEAKRVGFRRVAYWFNYPAYNTPQAEAAAAKSIIPLEPGDGLMADFENDPNARPWPADGLAWGRAFLDAWAPSGYRSAWYASPSFIAEHNLSALAPTYPLVWAQWSAARPSFGSTGAVLWQYTNRGSMAGVSGFCDLSQVVGDLRRLFTGPGPGGLSTMSGGNIQEAPFDPGRLDVVEVAANGHVMRTFDPGGAGQIDNLKDADWIEVDPEGVPPAGFDEVSWCWSRNDADGVWRMNMWAKTQGHPYLAVIDISGAEVQGWVPVSGILGRVPSGNGSGTLVPHTHEFTVPIIDGTTSQPHTT